MTKQLIRFDWAIKRLLRNKANFSVLEGFLSELLFEPIKILRIIEGESNQDTEDDKFNRVDILTENAKSELVIVEIQNSYEIDYFHRMAYGTSKAVSEHLDIGEDYGAIKKVIAVHIVYFDLGQGKDYIYRGRTDFRGMHQNDVLGLSEKQKTRFLKRYVHEIFPEYYLLKVNQFDDNAKDTLDEWIYFLKHSEVKEGFHAKGLEEARQVLDTMRLSKSEAYGYNRYLDSLHLKASEAMTLKSEEEFKVREDERNLTNIGIAKKAIQIGLSNSQIANITGLSSETIEALRNETA